MKFDGDACKGASTQSANRAALLPGSRSIEYVERHAATTANQSRSAAGLSAVVNGGTGGDFQLRADSSFQGLLGIP
jgi:hypothetical protein